MNIRRICIFPDVISGVIILIIVKYSQKLAVNITAVKEYNWVSRTLIETSQSFNCQMSRLADNKSHIISDRWISFIRSDTQARVKDVREH